MTLPAAPGAVTPAPGHPPPPARLPAPALERVRPLSVVDRGFAGSAAFLRRASLLGLIVAIGFAVLGVRLWSLQILGSPVYSRAAKAQAWQVVRVPTARGSIVDRAGRPLADTDGRLVVTVDPRALGRGTGARWRPSAQGRARLARLAELAGVPLRLLVDRIQRELARSPYTAPVVLPRVSRWLAFYLEERGRELPWLRIAAVPERRYAQGSLGASFLGLLGEIGPAELRQPRYRGYRMGDVIGRSGVEATYDRVLGAPSRRARVRVDALGRPRGPLRVAGPRPLRSLQLTVDARLQRAVERALARGVESARAGGHPDASGGAAVVLDPRDGAILALASYPSFNQVAAARDRRYLARLLDPANPDRPLVDRATQGVYPPGSTFKPLVAAAAIGSGVIAPSSVLPCTGSLQVGNTVFRNVEAGINALLTLPQALAISCDTWFYRLGLRLYQRQRATGRPVLQRGVSRFGFGRRTGIDLPGESAGVVGTPAWLRRVFSQPWQRVWYPGYTVTMSIGQGYLAVTPLQLAVAYAAIANGGRLVRPHLGKAVLDASGQVVRRLSFPPRARIRIPGLAAIRAGLYAAAHAPEGTSARIFADFPVPVAGKTGTAEAPPGGDHSWYASYAPAGRPRAVVVVLVEHGGFGAETAAPVAREIWSAFFRLFPQRGR
ncbi:MAG: penicillin-binding protein 2 [Thermoleophilia bacterium]